MFYDSGDVTYNMIILSVEFEADIAIDIASNDCHRVGEDPAPNPRQWLSVAWAHTYHLIVMRAGILIIDDKRR